jgi:hypothetical protein
MSYKIEDYAKLGTLYKLIDGVNVDSPEPKQLFATVHTPD